MTEREKLTFLENQLIRQTIIALMFGPAILVMLAVGKDDSAFWLSIAYLVLSAIIIVGESGSKR